MPFTAPPTFVDNQVLSASQLNILSDDVEYLHGLSQAANIPFGTIRASDINHLWQIRHRLDYLHWRLESDGGGGATTWNWSINYGGTVVASGSTTSAPGFVASGSVALTPSVLVTVGNWYPITVLTTAPSGTVAGNYFEVSYVVEKSTA